MAGRLLIANHLDQSLWLANKKSGPPAQSGVEGHLLLNSPALRVSPSVEITWFFFNNVFLMIPCGYLTEYPLENHKLWNALMLTSVSFSKMLPWDFMLCKYMSRYTKKTFGGFYIPKQPSSIWKACEWRRQKCGNTDACVLLCLWEPAVFFFMQFLYVA
jgi:hypothetical protein